MQDAKSTYNAVALLSGGLDSILAVKVAQEQGLTVKCLHFTSPFFGKPHLLSRWERLHDLDIEALDLGREYVDMLFARPPHGFGKILNPCVDCKILMLHHARKRMEELGATMILSGEVLGQRPMSQRRDALHLISRDAEVRDVLVRPLTALRIDPTQPELDGRIDRSRLLNISGRGRKDQLALAEHFKLKEIPTPAGGCLLAEKESARRYWPVLQHAGRSLAQDFDLANTGRQFWHGPHWLSIGRNKADNEHLQELAAPTDLILKVRNFPGPLAIGRQFPGQTWPPEAVRSAAAFIASFSPKARKSEGPVEVTATCGNQTGSLTITPANDNTWIEPSWDDAKEALDQERQEKLKG